MSLILAVGGLRQQDGEFETNLDSTTKPKLLLKVIQPKIKSINDKFVIGKILKWANRDGTTLSKT